MIRALFTSIAALAFMAASVSAQTIAIYGKIWTGENPDSVEKGIVIVRNGKVTQVGGEDLKVPEDATVINYPGSWVTPGIIAPFTRTGIVEVGAEQSTDDRGGGSEKFSASIKAVDGFNPSATTVPITRLEGVTHIAVAPTVGSTLVGGLGFIADTSGEADSVLNEASFLYVELGESGASKAGGSRSASWAYLRGVLGEGEKSRIGTYRSRDNNLTSQIDALVLSQVVRGRIPVMIRAHRASDLRSIIALKSEYRNLEVIIVGAREGWIVAGELAGADIPVIIDPFDNLPSSFESLGATGRNAERLIDAGVQTAFAHLGDDGHQARLALQVAGNAVSNGVEHGDALAAITRVPAEIFGLNNVGTIKRGADAHIVVWDGDPLEITSSPHAVLIGGTLQRLESRQTKLRDRYLCSGGCLEDMDSHDF